MNLVQILLIAFVAFLHFYFLVLEMFLWTKPKGIKAFRLTEEFAKQTEVLAANQGLYNGFLAAGLMYSLVMANRNFVLFFLGCVIVAGIYGAYSTKKARLFYVQSIPAILAFIITVLNSQL